MRIRGRIFLFLMWQIALIITGLKVKSGQKVNDYGFVAYLFRKGYSHKCTGAIVAKSWILNYCQPKGDFQYNAIKVGPNANAINQYSFEQLTYDLVKRITYPEQQVYYYPDVDEKFNLSNLYATKHALFLDQTDREITFIVGIVRPIAISQTTKLPPVANIIFFSALYTKQIPQQNKLAIINKQKCNDYFKKYNFSLFEAQYCANSKKLTARECCASHAIMEYNNLLIGIMAWSTACWEPPEYWVFSNMGNYYNWIVEITSDDPIFP